MASVFSVLAVSSVDPIDAILRGLAVNAVGSILAGGSVLTIDSVPAVNAVDTVLTVNAVSTSETLLAYVSLGDNVNSLTCRTKGKLSLLPYFDQRSKELSDVLAKICPCLPIPVL